MQRIDLFENLKQNAYPGRGMVLGISADGKYAVIAYFIMGRSEKSRNRIFSEIDGGMIIEAFDPAKLEDSSLILYTPVCLVGTGVTVVSNGDQTDTITGFLKNGGTFEDALRTRTFEPDAPHFTPRISGVMEVQDGRARYKLSILKTLGGDPESIQRFFFEYPSPKAGVGHFLHTYAADGNPIPSFEGEPRRVSVTGEQDAFTNALWTSLDTDNKVSLFTSYIDLDSGKAQTRVINKQKEPNGG